MGMIFHPSEPDNIFPDTESHLGGIPFFTDNDKWPTCPHCSEDMQFFLQLNEVTKEKKNILRTYYKCDCKLDTFEPIIHILEYHNPDMKFSVSPDNKSKKAHYTEITFEPAWSIPHWNLLSETAPEIYEDILTECKHNPEVAEDYYNSIRWNTNCITSEPYCLIAGYPQFITDPIIPKCTCCKEPMKFQFQLDTLDQKHINWNDGALYCFACEKTNTIYFRIN